MSKAYSSNLTLSEWEFLESMIPNPKLGGRPRSVEMWDVLNAIFAPPVSGLHVAQLAGRLSSLADGLHL